MASSSQIPPSTIILILDIHPLSWGILSSLPPAPPTGNKHIDVASVDGLTLGAFLDVLMIFLNAHLAERWGNDVAVYATSARRAKLVYPAPATHPAGPKPKANTFRPFQLLSGRIEEGIKEMYSEEEKKLSGGQIKYMNEPPAMVSALTKALCFINQNLSLPSTDATDPSAFPASAPGTASLDKREVRIMVINSTPGSVVGGQYNGEAEGSSNGGGGTKGGYVGLMNCVFAAQKAKIPIDVLSLPPPQVDPSPPIFLQQAAHLTEGVYWGWNGRGGLLSYLHSIYLTPPSLRNHPFPVPPQDTIGFRAVCFCHHKTLDVGFVCSVCLSIFCEPRFTCSMCKTKFPLPSIKPLREILKLTSPIPIPDTILRPPAVGGGAAGDAARSLAGAGRKDAAGGGGGAGAGGRGEPIVID